MCVAHKAKRRGRVPIAAVAVVGALMGRRKEPPHSCPPAAHVSAPRATSSRAASLGLFAERFSPSVVRLGRSVCRSLLFHTDDGASGMLLAPFLSCQDPIPGQNLSAFLGMSLCRDLSVETGLQTCGGNRLYHGQALPGVAVVILKFRCI